MKNPKIKLKPTPLDKILSGASLIGLVAMVIYVLITFPDLPVRVPSHFGADGKPDQWSGPFSIVVLPAMSVFVYGMTTFFSRHPHVANYPVKITIHNARFMYTNATRMLHILNIHTVFFLGSMTYKTIETALGNANGLGEYLMIFYLGSLFLILGFFIVRMYLYRSPKVNKFV